MGSEMCIRDRKKPGYAPVLRLQGRRDGGTKIVTENMDLRFFKLNRVSLASLNLPNVG